MTFSQVIINPNWQDMFVLVQNGMAEHAHAGKVDTLYYRTSCCDVKLPLSMACQQFIVRAGRVGDYLSNNVTSLPILKMIENILKILLTLCVLSSGLEWY